jgi:hypothetical protein
MKGGDEDSEEAADGEAEISIVGRRRKGSVVQYLLRWDSGAQTWESAADGAEPLMAEYDEQNPQPTPGKKRGAPWGTAAMEQGRHRRHEAREAHRPWSTGGTAAMEQGRHSGHEAREAQRP